MAAPRVLFRSPPVNRRQQTVHPKSKIGEMAGGTAAVCCCCPCTLMKLLVSVVYKVPVGVWRRQKRRRLAKKKMALMLLNEDGNKKISSATVDGDEMEFKACDKNEEKLDKTMWDTFHGTGFWRSPSLKDT